MRKFLCGFICGAIIFSSTAFAYRAPRPHQMTMPWTDNQVVELNNILEDFWNIDNGRYTMDITTTNPDGNTTGDVGDAVLYNNSGTYYYEINVDGGTTWVGVALTDTP